MLTLLLALTHDANACAGFFHNPDVIAESAYQEIILSQGEGYIQAEYKAEIETTTPDFGWVIPIPGTFKALEDGDNDRFTQLFDATTPIWDLEEPKQGCGFGARSLKGGDNALDSAGGGIDIVYQGSTPTYDFTVVEATNSTLLTDWLTTNGWTIGTSAPAIEEYVQDGSYQFVAIKLNLDSAEQDNITQGVIADLPPIKIQYQGDKLQYPARMARYSDSEYIKTIIYVEGDQRAHTTNWNEEEVSLIWDDGESVDYMKYEAYPEKIGTLGRDGTLATTWSGEHNGKWITRFELSAPREIYTLDIEFALNGGTETPVALTVSNMGGCQTPEGAEALLLIPLTLLARRRKK